MWSWARGTLSPRTAPARWLTSVPGLSEHAQRHPGPVTQACGSQPCPVSTLGPSGRGAPHPTCAAACRRSPALGPATPYNLKAVGCCHNSPRFIASHPPWAWLAACVWQVLASSTGTAGVRVWCGQNLGPRAWFAFIRLFAPHGRACHSHTT